MRETRLENVISRDNLLIRIACHMRHVFYLLLCLIINDHIVVSGVETFNQRDHSENRTAFNLPISTNHLRKT